MRHSAVAARWLVVGAVAAFVGARGDAAATSQWTATGVPVAVADQPYYRYLDAALPDGQGGAFVAYMERALPHVQRLDATGGRVWGDAAKSLTDVPTNFSTWPTIAPDAADGVIVAWMHSVDYEPLSIFAQRLDGDGNRLWDAGGGDLNGIVVWSGDVSHQPDGLSVVSDGSGGAVLLWDEGGTETALRMQRLDAAGVPQWGALGVLVHTAPPFKVGAMSLAPDGAGGAFVAWDDLKDNYDSDVRALHIDASGALAPGFPAEGLPLCLATGLQRGARIVPDGGGGVFAAWFDPRSGGALADIYGQHVLADGALPWGAADGLLLASSTNTQDDAELAADGAGGFVMTWASGDTDLVHGDVAAQRFDASGGAEWNGGSPVWVCNAAGSQRYVHLAVAGASTVVCWSDLRGIIPGNGECVVRAQKLSAAGALVWGASTDGVVLSGGPENRAWKSLLVPDATGGAIVFWDKDYFADTCDVYAQRVAGPDDLVPVRQFLLPTKVTRKVNAKNPGKDVLTLSATLDTGPDSVAFDSSAGLTIGALSFQLSGLAQDRKGVWRLHRNDLTLAVVPGVAGSSRCTMTATLKGPEVILVNPDDAFSMLFSCGDVAADGGCTLAKGAFTLGRGRIPNETSVPRSAKATLVGPGKDSFSVKWVVAPSDPPTQMSDIVFQFGPTYSKTIPGASFKRRGAVFTFTDKTNALPSMTIDTATGFITVTGKKADLGSFAEGAQAVRFVAGPTDDASMVDVRMVRKGKALTY